MPPTNATGLACPHCAATNTDVASTRALADHIRRRRNCLSCGRRFTTYELVAPGPGAGAPVPALAGAAHHVAETFAHLDNLRVLLAPLLDAVNGVLPLTHPKQKATRT